MRAARLHGYGGPDMLRLDEIAPPDPGPGTVLVQVHAVSVNPVDWKIREGQRRERMPLDLPVILGCDFSGTVIAPASDVADYRPSDAVFGMTGLSGAFAEQIAVPVGQLAPKPPTLDHPHAAAVPLAALTAWQALHLGRIASGQRVLIHAAAGGVGGFAVQIARALGATVIGTASAANLDYLRGLGAEPIDYRATRFEDAAQDIDLVLDLIGGETQDRSWPVLRPGGRLISSVAVPPPDDPRLQGRRALRIGVRPIGPNLTEIARLIDRGAVRVEIGQMLPFADVGEALERNRQGQAGRGKTVLLF